MFSNRIQSNINFFEIAFYCLNKQIRILINLIKWRIVITGIFICVISVQNWLAFFLSKYKLLIILYQQLQIITYLKIKHAQNKSLILIEIKKN